MKANLSSNKELDNYKGQDAFNFIIKANAIKSFLEFSLESLKDNKMIVLYGDWGSGKSSLMKHLEKEINEAIYYPIFFKAWEHEKDDNLALSLCDAITNSLDKHNEVIKDFMKAAFATLKCFASGITIKAPSFLTGLGLDAEFSGEKYIKAIDESLKDKEPISFYKTLEDFKVKFQKIEKLILGNKAQKLLIFIDDLDRCEPENVLNLITAIKLFFTYGEDSVYFCGLDKNAVKMAVKTKYKDEVKAEEYLEKVFDISFNMPKTYEIRDMLKPHFKDFNFYYKNVNRKEEQINSVNIIEEFFEAIHLNNPRRLKKVLNKYEILKAYKNSKDIKNDFKNLIPNIISANKKGKIFETIYCLYIIILYEFHLDEFLEIENYEHKIVNYLKIAKDKITEGLAIKGLLYLDNYKNTSFKNLQASEDGDKYGYSKFLFIFSNSNPISINYMYNNQLDRFAQHFPDNSLPTNFCKFLIKYLEEIEAESNDSEYIIWNLFNMAKYLL